MVKEYLVFVFFDIPNDKIRNRIGEACKDYGLERIQYSGFMGNLSRNKIEELYLRMKREIGENFARVIIQPVCSRCQDSAFIIGEMIKDIEEKDKIVEFNINSQDMWNNYNYLPFTED